MGRKGHEATGEVFAPPRRSAVKIGEKQVQKTVVELSRASAGFSVGMDIRQQACMEERDHKRQPEGVRRRGKGRWREQSKSHVLERREKGQQRRVAKGIRELHQQV